MSETKMPLEEVARFRNMKLLAKQIVEGFITGLHKSPFHGFSVEFAEYRLYNSGESTRNIDWKLFARTDKLFTKRYDEETNLRAYLVIDNSSSMHFKGAYNIEYEQALTKLQFSVLASAALIEILKKQRDAFGLSVFSNKMDVQTAVKSSAVHQEYLYQILSSMMEEQHEKKTSSIAKSLHEFAEKIHKRSLVVIFTDAFTQNENQEEIFEALKHLKHYKHEILFFHVYDRPAEFLLDYPNRPHWFIDLETDTKVKVNPIEIREGYINKLNERFIELKRRCAQYQIDYIEADVSKGFTPILQSYFKKRSRLF